MEKNKKVAGELAKIKEDTVKDFLSMLPGASFNVNAGVSFIHSINLVSSSLL